MGKWPFADPKNVAVITCREIMTGVVQACYATHDADDGMWQFHPDYSNPCKEEDAMLVSLESIYKIDPTIGELADLPMGWSARRKNKYCEWKKSRKR